MPGFHPIKLYNMEIFYLEYRLIYSDNIIKKVFSTVVDRYNFISTHNLNNKAAFLYKAEYVINSQQELIETLNLILD